LLILYLMPLIMASSHGGKIELSDSELGGLRVLISIPL
jgi:hypothetical protein